MNSLQKIISQLLLRIKCSVQMGTEQSSKPPISPQVGFLVENFFRPSLLQLSNPRFFFKGSNLATNLPDDSETKRLTSGRTSTQWDGKHLKISVQSNSNQPSSGKKKIYHLPDWHFQWPSSPVFVDVQVEEASSWQPLRPKRNEVHQPSKRKKKKNKWCRGGINRKKKCIFKKPQGSRFLWHSDAIQRGVFHCFFFTCKRVNMKNS